MYRYGKTTQSAIAVMSRLAQSYGDPGRWLSSKEIAASRNLSKPLVAKVLNILSQAELVEGTPGPAGGYRMTTQPANISLLDVVKLFERPEEELGCAFGPGWCGRSQDKCPLHDDLNAMRERMIDYLTRTRFDVFRPGLAPGNRG